MELLNFK